MSVLVLSSGMHSATSCCKDVIGKCPSLRCHMGLSSVSCQCQLDTVQSGLDELCARAFGGQKPVTYSHSVQGFREAATMSIYTVWASTLRTLPMQNHCAAALEMLDSSLARVALLLRPAQQAFDPGIPQRSVQELSWCLVHVFGI